jgi:hypothetical protein
MRQLVQSSFIVQANRLQTLSPARQTPTVQRFNVSFMGRLYIAETLSIEDWLGTEVFRSLCGIEPVAAANPVAGQRRQLGGSEPGSRCRCSSKAAVPLQHPR